MRSIYAIIAALCLALPGLAQNTTVTASHIESDLQGDLLTGKVCLTAVLNSHASAFSADGAAQIIPGQESCYPVTAGVASFSVPDVNLANPQGIGYKVVVKQGNGLPLYSYPTPIYPTGATWSLDSYAATQVANVTTPTLQLSTSTPTGDCGSAIAIDVVGTIQSGLSLYACASHSWNLISSGGGTQADWNTLLNKPTLAPVATSGSYNDLTNKPTLGTAAAHPATDFDSAGSASSAQSAAEAASDPAGSASTAQANAKSYTDSSISGLATVARTGSYNDLTDKPTSSPGTISLENVYTAPGSFTFQHNLNTYLYQIHCITKVNGVYASASWSDYPVDANDVSVKVPAAGDYTCSFSAAGALPPDFLIAASPSSQTIWPTMKGTQTGTLAINQTAIGGYSGAASYTTSGLASGMTGAFSPSSITGSGSSTLTLSFPANQASGTTAFTVTGSDGTKTHTASPLITIGNINDGLVDCWALNDGSTLSDSCGTNNNETLATGTLTWASNAGLPGTTPTFSSTAYATGTNATATNFDGTTPFSVSAWFKSSTPATVALVSSLLVSPSFQGWELSTYNSDLFFNLYSSNTNHLQVSSNQALSANTLYYAVLTYDGSRTAAGVKLYVNGAATATTTFSSNLTASTANNTPVSLGGRPGGGVPLNGTLAYVRIYNRVLSATDVASYYAAGAR